MIIIIIIIITIIIMIIIMIKSLWMETATELKIWLEKALDACANEGGTNFSGKLIMYYTTLLL